MVFFSLSWRLQDLLWEYRLLCWKHENGNIMRPLVSSYLFLGKSVSWQFCWIPSMLDVIRAHAYCLKLVSLEIHLLIQASSLTLAIILTLFQSCCLVTPPTIFKGKRDEENEFSFRNIGHGFLLRNVKCSHYNRQQSPNLFCPLNWYLDVSSIDFLGTSVLYMFKILFHLWSVL